MGRLEPDAGLPVEGEGHGEWTCTESQSVSYRVIGRHLKLCRWVVTRSVSYRDLPNYLLLALPFSPSIGHGPRGSSGQGQQQPLGPLCTG